MRRPWLLPFTPLYALAVGMRNFFFDKGVLKSNKFDTPTLVIGNLNTGGSGKTPHTEFFLHHFQDLNTAVISRGYGRKTTGFQWVEAAMHADQSGDEPLQIKNKFRNTAVAVCEDRVMAIPELLASYPDTQLILFDDAFQHRYLDAHARVLLSVYDDFFADDMLLPAGHLREAKKGASRADVLIVTKCPEGLSEADKSRIMEKARPYFSGPIFFSRFVAQEPILLHPDLENLNFKEHDVFVFSAIAHGCQWAEGFLSRFKKKVGELCYGDHHRFSRHDINLFLKKWKEAGKPIVITTEKDWMRLKAFANELKEVPLLYFPIEVEVDGDEQDLMAILRLKLQLGF